MMPTGSHFADLDRDEGNGGAIWHLLSAHQRVTHEPSPHANSLPTVISVQN